MRVKMLVNIIRYRWSRSSAIPVFDTAVRCYVMSLVSWFIFLIERSANEDLLFGSCR